MSSAQDFTCVFCKEVFEDKETLQEHFRKHGDPKFNITKSKGRTQNDQTAMGDKAEDGEVGCDVCDEVFPSISKAITHKHKVHPDHDAKYFCPWCGKLFTMKHLYNKHMLTTHESMSKTDENFYHCDSCNVDFFVPSAMVYHNRFFHRQDTELPSIGHSKKVKTVNQEMIQIYYCPFCGEEYNNKVNLHKHMGDDHSDENQSPDEVLRCPLCDAVFYHLDAYELHLSFHSSEDIYNDENEIILDIMEFSLESVPPIMEKVEEDNNYDNKGIDKFLQLIMDESRESGNSDMNDKPKSKKHKKHKKSKKSAITLDEFLNMNKDVFGDGLDVQGIEEVPTQQVLKKYKGKKDNVVKPVPASAIAKLKKQGITVKSNSGIKFSTLNSNRKVTANASNTIPTRIPVKESPKSVATSNELLSKLLNQGNSQIKIVKKSSTENISKEQIISQAEHQEPSEKSSEYNTLSSHTGDTEEASAVEKMTQNIGDKQCKNELKIKSINNGENNNETDIQDGTHKSVLKSNSTTVNKESNVYTNPNENKDDDSETDDTVKSKSKNITDINQYGTDIHMKDKFDSFNTNENLGANTSDEEISEPTEDETNTDLEANYQQENTNKTQTPNKSLEALKHLSGVITVKPAYNAEEKSNIIETGSISPEKTDAEYMVDGIPSFDKVLSKNHQNVTNITNFNAPQMISDIPNNSLDALKNLNKQLTIKPCVTANSTSKCDDQSESDDNNYDSQDMPSKNINSEKDSTYFKTPTSITKQSNTKSNNSLTINKPTQIKNTAKEFVKEENTQKSINMDILKRLTNVTAKPISVTTNNQVTKSGQVTTSPTPFIKKVEKSKQIDQDIEIYNIDDSDSDQEAPYEEPSPKQLVNTQSNDVKTTSVNVLKNLSKNITIKSPNSPNNQNILNTKNDMQGECSRLNTDKNVQSPTSNDNKPNFQKKQLSMNLSHTLKKLGNNISIKSQFSFDSQKYQMQHDDDMDDNFDMNDEESDLETTNNVKISEVHEDDEDIPSEIDIEYNGNVIVQSPHASNSENEEETHNYSDDDANEDLESEIKTNMLPKENPASKCLDNFKRNNTQLTIKSLNERNTDIPLGNSPSSKKEDMTRLTKNLSKDLSMKQVRDTEKHDNNEVVAKNFNQSTASSSASQKVINQVNTVKTVKTIQSETIIEEITTTVTKTIRTVNQSTKQVAQNANVRSTYKPRFTSPHQQGKPIHGMMVRNAQTVGTKIRGAAPSPRPPPTPPVKATGQLVPVRPQNQIVPRQAVLRPRLPGPSNIRKISPQPNVQKPVIGKALKISPQAMNQSVKRPLDDMSGHFNSFKKPKDLIVPSVDSLDDEQCDDSTINYASASSSRSDFSTATKIVKGKSVITATQSRSEQHSEQITKLNSMSGLKIVRTNAKQASQVETRNDMCAAKRTTMDAIERLQKQGLLIKKPRIETPEESEHYSPQSDEDFEDE